MQTLYFSYTLQTKAAAVAVVVILISLIGLCVTSSVAPLGIQMNGFPNAIFQSNDPYFLLVLN